MRPARNEGRNWVHGYKLGTEFINKFRRVPKSSMYPRVLTTLKENCECEKRSSDDDLKSRSPLRVVWKSWVQLRTWVHAGNHSHILYPVNCFVPIKYGYTGVEVQCQ